MPDSCLSTEIETTLRARQGENGMICQHPTQRMSPACCAQPCQRKRLRSKTALSLNGRCTKRLATAAPLQAYVDGALVQPEDLVRASSASVSNKPQIAIAVCTRGCPVARLQEWLFWHLSLGVHMIFMRWEGPMDSEQEETLKGPLASGKLVLKKQAQGDLNSAFNSVMIRQVKYVQSIMEVAGKRGIDFLLHIDDDEILFPFRKCITMSELFRYHVGSSKRCIHFENYEANFKFEESTLRPFTRPSTMFRIDCQALYCNGKSAANLALSPNYASGVHKFCIYDRCFVSPDPAFGEHDNCSGCTHRDCCVVEPGAVILHFDSPTFAEWQSKFAQRASSKLSVADREEMDCFEFKKRSIAVFRKKPAASQKAQEAVYRHWRCLPNAVPCHLSQRITGVEVEKRFVEHVEALRRGHQTMRE